MVHTGSLMTMLDVNYDLFMAKKEIIVIYDFFTESKAPFPDLRHLYGLFKAFT